MLWRMNICQGVKILVLGGGLAYIYICHRCSSPNITPETYVCPYSPTKWSQRNNSIRDYPSSNQPNKQKNHSIEWDFSGQHIMYIYIYIIALKPHHVIVSVMATITQTNRAAGNSAPDAGNGSKETWPSINSQAATANAGHKARLQRSTCARLSQVKAEVPSPSAGRTAAPSAAPSRGKTYHIYIYIRLTYHIIFYYIHILYVFHRINVWYIFLHISLNSTGFM